SSRDMVLCISEMYVLLSGFFFFSSRRRHTRFSRDWSSDVCSSDINKVSKTVFKACIDIKDMTFQFVIHMPKVCQRIVIPVQQKSFLTHQVNVGIVTLGYPQWISITVRKLSIGIQLIGSHLHTAVLRPSHCFFCMDKAQVCQEL